MQLQLSLLWQLLPWLRQWVDQKLQDKDRCKYILYCTYDPLWFQKLNGVPEFLMHFYLFTLYRLLLYDWLANYNRCTYNSFILYVKFKPFPGFLDVDGGWCSLWSYITHIRMDFVVIHILIPSLLICFSLLDFPSCRYNCGYNLGSCSCTYNCHNYGNCCPDYNSEFLLIRHFRITSCKNR